MMRDSFSHGWTICSDLHAERSHANARRSRQRVGMMPGLRASGAPKCGGALLIPSWVNARSDWSRFRLSNPATLACFIVRQVPSEAAPLDDLEPEALEGVDQALTTARTTKKAAASALGQLRLPQRVERRVPRLRLYLE